MSRIDGRYLITTCSVSPERHSTTLYTPDNGLDWEFADETNAELTRPIEHQMYLRDVVFSTGIADHGDRFIVASARPIWPAE